MHFTSRSGHCSLPCSMRVFHDLLQTCLLCWGGNVSQGGKEIITRIMNQVGRMIGEPRQNFEAVYADLLISDVMDDPSYPLHDRRSADFKIWPHAFVICRDWPIPFLICSTGNQNSQCKLSEWNNFHWYVICFL